MTIHCQLCFLASLVLVIDAGPILRAADDVGIATSYLKSFYSLVEMPRNPGAKQPDLMPGKLTEMQTFFRLKVTGTLDKETLEVMKKPRCGIPDVAEFSTFGESTKWPTNTLTYRIVNYTPDLSVAEVDQSMERALQVWAKVTPLTFTRIYSGTADIMISFVIREHGDGIPFNGPDKVLAHAFTPSTGIGGDAHFNDDQVFTSRPPRDGFDLFLVAAHEFGHSLGLSHSNIPGALMFPTYSFQESFTLSSDDIERIQSLYGPRKTTATTTTSIRDCDVVVDAVTTFRGETIFFKGRFFWKKSSNRSVQKDSIQSLWPNTPDNIDAAYEDPLEDRVFLFKGKQVWAFNGRNLEPGYPKNLSSFGLPPSVTKVSAAFHDEKSGKTLLFFGLYYYSYNERTKKMDKGNPKRLENGFPGVTEEVTAAYMSNDNIYLFSGTTVYEFSYSNRNLARVLSNRNFPPCI